MFWADWIITGTVIVCLLGLGVAMWSLWGTRPDSEIAPDSELDSEATPKGE